MKKLVALIMAGAVIMSMTAVFADETNEVIGTADEATEIVVIDDSVGDGEPGAESFNPDADGNGIDDEYEDVFGPDEIGIFVDGIPLKADVPAQIIEDRTMVPMRAIFERLGAKVEWISEDKAIFAMKANMLITMQIGNKSIGKTVLPTTSETITLDVPPQIVDDRTLVPIRAVSEALGCEVNWNGETRTVFITSK